MEFASSAFGVGLLKIIGIDIVLSGDNALVIALACRSLPTEKRKWGVLMGSVDRRRRNSLWPETEAPVARRGVSRRKHRSALGFRRRRQTAERRSSARSLRPLSPQRREFALHGPRGNTPFFTVPAFGLTTRFVAAKALDNDNTGIQNANTGAKRDPEQYRWDSPCNAAAVEAGG